MKQHLENFIYNRVKSPNEREVQEVLSIFTERCYKKGQFFKERNTIVQALGFLISGSTRSYIINKKGVEITGNIVQENNFIADIVSVRTNEKTPVVIEFLEDAQLVVAPIPAVKKLLESNLLFNILIREYVADKAVEMSKRQITFLAGTAKERYQYMLETNPRLLEKFPLRFIATMIGITPTQLSRIRKQKS